MLNLIGTYECKIDPKGRIMLAAPLKKQLSTMLDDGFIIKRSVFGSCLELYPRKEWDREAEGVNKLNRFVKKNVEFLRMFMAGVKPIELDTTGKFLITKDLLTFAGIKKDVVLASSVNKIEIWDKASYERAVSGENVDFGSLAEEVMGSFGNSVE